ncbi:MAG: hypothetical protein D6753_11895, partial [Planctomycetota bacterium]
LDPGVDVLLGVDGDGADGWGIEVPVVGIPAGSQVFLAQARDATALTSHVVSASVQVESAIYWDGDAGDFNWHTAANWSTDSVPGPSDVAVLNVPGVIDVQVNNSISVQRILSEESISFNGAFVTVTGPSVLNGSVSVSGSTITASGPMAEISFTGGATLNTINLIAQSGGRLLFGVGSTFATNSHISTTIQAAGAGSFIDLSTFSSFTGTSGTRGHTTFFTRINAFDGGVIDLSGVTSVHNQVHFQSHGQDSQGNPSLVDLSSLTEFAGGGRGQIVSVVGTGVVSAPRLNSLNGTTLLATSGGRIDFSSAVSYAGGAGFQTLVQADGEGSQIDLAGVTTFSGATGSQGHTVFFSVINAFNGAQVNLSATGVISNQTRVSASGQDSQGRASAIDLSSLTQLAGGGRGQSLSVADVGVIRVPVLQSISTSSLVATGGATLDLSSVTSYNGGSSVSHAIRADGENSLVDLSSLTSFVGTTGSQGHTIFFSDIQALGGGKVDLRNVLTSAGQSRYLSSGEDSSHNPSMIDLRSLQEVLGNSLNSMGVSEAGQIDLASLSVLRGTSLTASNGGSLDVPTVREYHGLTVNNNLIQADGSGSQIGLSGLQVLAGNTGNRGHSLWFLNIAAINDGSVMLGTGTNTVSGRVSLNSESGVISAGRLDVAAGTTFAATGLFRGNVVNGTNMSIGANNGTSIGTLHVDGDFEQRAAGALTLKIGGTTAGSAHDQLVVNGTANLDGSLVLRLVNGYAATPGDQLQVLTFGSRVCDFHTKSGTDLGGGLHLAASFGATAMTFTAGNTPDSGQQCTTVPHFTGISIGPDPAKAGDPLSITFEVDVPLQNNPTVSVDGNPATFVSQDGSVFSYSYIVTGTESEGPVDVAMVGVAQADGGIGSETVQVTLDFTDPVVSNVTASPDPADVGQTVEVSFFSSEPLSSSTVVTVGGLEASLTSVNGLNYIYSRTLTGGEGIGAVPVEVAAADLAGNTSSTTGAVIVFSGGLSLKAVGLDLSTDMPNVGDTVSAVITIENTGLFPIVDVPLGLVLVEPTGPRDLGTFTVPSIPAHGTAELATDLDIRSTGLHVLRATVDPIDTILEDDESDNVATRSLIAGSISGDGIEVTANLSAVTGVPGELVTVNGTASYDAALNPAGPVARGPVTVRIPGLNFVATTITDASGAFTLDFNMPPQPGNYVANVRAGDTALEGLTVLPFTVTLPPSGVDLFTSSSHIEISDSSPVVGEPVTISAAVLNVGGSDFAGLAEVEFYDGVNLIGTDTISSLASGASATVSISHAFATPGARTIRAVVDPNDVVVELNENNNATTRTLTVLDTVPELAPVDILFSDPAPATSQAVMITALVRNNGGAEATNVGVQFFDNGSPLGAAVIPVLPGEGATTSVAIQSTIEVAGMHAISVVVDPDDLITELNESNNTRIETLDVHDPVADLAPSSISLSNSSPLAGESIDVNVTVRNDGEASAGAFEVQFLADGTPFASLPVAGLAPGTTTAVSASTVFSLAGEHTVSVVVDHTSAVIELSESNNRAIQALNVLATPLADLAIDADDFVLSDSNPGVGEPISVTVPVFNRGSALAAGVTAQLQIDGAIVAATTTTPADIDSGGNATASFNFHAPLAEGYHLLEVIIDEGNTTPESNENNNRDFLFFLVGDFPDLLPLGIGFSNATPVEGETVSISATIQNDGQASADGFVVRVFDGSQVIGQVSLSGLDVGESTVISVPFDTAGKTGTRLIQVVADPDDRITENNEGNNLVNVLLNVAPSDATAPTTTATITPTPNSAGWNHTDTDLTLTAVDSGSGVALISYSIDGGPSTTLFSDTVTLSFTDEAIHTIQYHAVDFAQNAEPVQTVHVRIDKTVPNPIHAGPFIVAEGSTLLLDGSASTDALSGIANRSWDLDDDGQFDASDPAVAHAPDGPAIIPVSLRVVDAAGNHAVETTQITVLNVAPTFEAGPDATLLPAVAGAFSRPGITIIDPGTDTWSGIVDFGDGSGEQPLAIDQSSRTFDLAHVFSTSGTFTIRVSVVDDDGGSHTDSFNVEVVLNTPPAARDDEIGSDEDHAVTFNVLADNGMGPDADAEGNIDSTLTVNVSSPTRGVLTNLSDGRFTFDPADDFHFLAAGQQATESFRYRIEDAFGATDTAEVTISISGRNDAPTVATNSAIISVDEGQIATNGGTFQDLDLTDSVTISASIGDIVHDPGNNGTWTWSFSAADGPGDSTAVTITAIDGNGGAASTTFLLDVNNAVPAITSVAVDRTTIVEGEGILLSGVFTDAGTLDTHTVEVDWGDGTTSNATVDPISRT